jgi:hypothetical protein
MIDSVGQVFLEWRRSSACDAGSCVEIAVRQEEVLMRDSLDTQGPNLVFAPVAWCEFLARVRRSLFFSLTH